jgi:hypothetical protein
VTATLEGGSFGTFNQRVGLSGAQENFNYVFNVQHFRSTDTSVTPLNQLTPGERRNNDSYDNWTYSTKLGANITDSFGVNAVARYTQSVLGFTGEDAVNFFPPAPEVLQSTQTDPQFFGRGEAVWSLLDGRFKNFFGVNYTNEWNHNVDPNLDSFTPPPAVARRRRMSASALRSIGAAKHGSFPGKPSFLDWKTRLRRCGRIRPARTTQPASSRRSRPMRRPATKPAGSAAVRIHAPALRRFEYSLR